MSDVSRIFAMIWLVALIFSAPATAENHWIELSGSYLGQTPPGLEPEIFAPGLVSTGWGDRDLIISPDGTEIYFCMLDRAGVFVRCTRLVDGHWTVPEVPSFSADPDFGCLELTMSADGQQVMFLSTRPIEGEAERPGWGNQNIFASDRSADGWGEAYAVPGPINTLDNEYYPSLTSDGTVYYTHHRRGDPPALWRSSLVDGQYGEPEQLPEQINCAGGTYNAFIASDESYLIMCIRGKDENIGPADYYISFRSPDDQWSEVVNLGPKINGPESTAGSAWVSLDGEYLFFSAGHRRTEVLFPEGRLTVEGMQQVHNSAGNGTLDIYWVRAESLEGLRPAR